MQASLLEILREIPDHCRREGKRFDLAMVSPPVARTSNNFGEIRMWLTILTKCNGLFDKSKLREIRARLDLVSM
jgi:hypothetical protein